ncbi:hypothetical protein Dda_7273 [Drechslerella dactyloides]|uniref:PIN domain-containing protein n=1 Tax=Drechslerella dactyloides TaxID=74499 RepID=A0AAD6IS32_DREDA|nr:hypothetical protein Dda_7273 [Drechslerella dactyloides]
MDINQEPKDGALSSNAPPDIAGRFQAGLRDPRAKVACPQCRWTGTNIAKHSLEEHGANLTGEQLAAAVSVADDKTPTLPQVATEDIQMEIDDTAAAAPPTARPPRRRFGGGGGRKVESANFDPDYVRNPRPGRNDNSSGPHRLFDHRADTARPGGARASGSQRGQHAQTTPHQPNTQRPSSQVPRPRNIQPHPTHHGAPVLLRKPPVVNAVAPTSPTASTSFTPVNQPGSDEDGSEQQPELILQPETRPISQEQLVAEVKGIYAGLVMVEAKCIEVDSKQAAAATQGGKDVPRLNNDQWQALIALHRTLLHEHHDFFLASQHPSAAPSLRKLAIKYAMPARMWRHGIHSFLELLRHRLPDSFEHMLEFIYLAYAMMALLYETVPAFADTWVECLGDLGRYRMAIEEGDPRDREVWMHVSRFWYSKGTDRQPNVGRLYHHLAILARPNILQQLFFYCKALAVAQPFSAARESILTLFDPTALKEQDIEGNQSADATFVLLHSICFTFVNQDAFADKKVDYLDLLDKKIGVTKLKFKVQGVYIAICGVASLFQYNLKEGRMKMATTAKENEKATKDAETSYKAAQMQKQDPDNSLPPGPVIDGHDPKNSLSVSPPELDPSLNFDISLTHAQELAFDILTLAFDRENDPAVQPHIHVWLVFLNYLKEYPEGMALIVRNFPWEKLAHYATQLLKKRRTDEAALERIHDSDSFPVVQKGFRPLPEEFMMRGLEIARRYFPYGYFSRIQVDDDERLIELPSMNLVREEKMLWLLVKFANYGPWLKYDPNRFSFSVSAELRTVLQEFNHLPNDQPIVRMADDSDIEMDEDPAAFAGEDEESLDEIENPELTQLLAQRRDLRKQLSDPNTVSAEEDKKLKTSAAFSAESFKPGFTTIVVDTNSIVKYLDVFKNILESNQWSIVLPYCVITELRGLQRNGGKVSETSEMALKVLGQALKEKKSLRIVTAKGNAIIDISVQFYELIEDYSEDGRKNLDDIIIETARAQGEISAKRISGSGTEPVVLITDDAVMRLKSITRGVASVSTKQWIQYMAPLDEATQRKIANTYHALMTKYPKLDQDRVYKAARYTAGDENSAASILRRDMSAKKRRAQAHMDRQKHPGIAG